MSARVEVPDPGCGLGTLSQGSIEMPGLAECFEIDRYRVPVDHCLGFTPTFWWADGHRDVPRGLGSEARGCLGQSPRPLGHKIPKETRAKPLLALGNGPQHGVRFFEYKHQKRPVCVAVTKVQSLSLTGLSWEQINNKKTYLWLLNKHICH